MGFFLYEQGRQAFEEKFLEWKHSWVPKPVIPVSQLASYAVCFSDIQMTIRRDGQGMSFSSGRTVLAGDVGWTCQELQRGVYSLRHRLWKKRQWTVDTIQGQVIETRRRGGGFFTSSKRLKVPVKSSRDTFSLSLGGGQITYDCKQKTHILAVGRYVLSECPGWESVCVEPDLYHMRSKGWGRQFWSIDTRGKRIRQAKHRCEFGRKKGRFVDLGYRIESQYLR